MLDLRDHFFVPAAPAVELRAFTHGLMPKTVPAMMKRFVEDWREHGVDAWNQVSNHWRPSSADVVGWWSLPDYLGDTFIAPLLSAPAGTCIMQPNVHWTVQCLLSAAEPFTAGRNEIVFSEGAFPSVQHSVYQWAAMQGLRPRPIPLGDDGFVNVEAVLDTITDRTAWVFLSHVGFTTGEKLTDDALRAVANTAHLHDALFCIDGYHATGSVAVDVEALHADVYVGGLLKEACGSTGNSYLYVREGLELTPRLSGWFADADPFGFQKEPQPHPEVRRRFLAGTTAIASLYHAVEGVRLLLEAGLENVRADSLAKTALAIELAEAAGLTLQSPREAERRGAMVILAVDEATPLCEWLKTEGVFTDSRQNRVLRLAPFVWNTAADIERAFALLAEGLKTSTYRDRALPASAGPVT